MYLCLLLAQSQVAGAVSTALDGFDWYLKFGALGLLAVVLVKLMPAKDQQITDILKRQDITLANQNTMLLDILSQGRSQLHAILTSQSAQLQAILTSQSEEREKDRLSRHEVANMMQIAVGEMDKNTRAMLMTIQKSLDEQTIIFKLEMNKTCGYRDAQHPHPHPQSTKKT